MSQFLFELAGPDDDADLRHVLAATPMAGPISVSFRREPSWFAAAVVDGFDRQTVACRDLHSGHIVAFGCRSLRELFVNGQPATVGYLSSLRALPQYRNRSLLARGYAFLRHLHQDCRTPYYLTTIAEGNETALRILTSGRAGLPSYHPLGRYHTSAISLLNVRSRSRKVASVQLRTARPADLRTVVDFMNRVGACRQFFPRYHSRDFLNTGLLHGLALDRVHIAERDGQLVGVLAGWDQSCYRQQVIHRYSSGMHGLRLGYNLFARLRGRPGLPAPGQPLRVLTAALPVIAENDSAIFMELLKQLLEQSRQGPWTHLLLGLHESDPLLEVARRFQTTCYTSLVYLVCWPDGEDARQALEKRPIYLELGSL